VRELGSSLEERLLKFHYMQETQPVHYRPEYNLWEVFRYKDIQQVLLDDATFPVERTSDPAQHRRKRVLMSKAFIPRRIEELTPHLIQIVDELLEPAITSGKMDVVAGLASPLPLRVIAEILGLPLADQERIRQWSSNQLLGKFTGTKSPDNDELHRYLSNLLDERKHDLRNDFISLLLAAEEREADLTREEIISICKELMVAGNSTTVMFLSMALQRLCQHPEIYQALRDDPSLIPGAIEEMLRYEFSGSNVWRIAYHDTVLGGQEIKAGQHVVVWIGAANFDETYFPQSSQFDIRRSPNSHLTFAYGVHVCLGISLARLESRIALERIVAHFSEIHLDPENPVQCRDQIAARLIQSLDVLFTPASPPALPI
jgi:cytochrome P450